MTSSFSFQSFLLRGLIGLACVLVAIGASAQSVCPFNLSGAGAGRITVDAMVLTRYARGIRGAVLTTGAVPAGTDTTGVEAFITATARRGLDVDGDGDFTTADALIIARYLSGQSASAWLDGVTLPSSATRRTPGEISLFIAQGCPTPPPLSIGGRCGTPYALAANETPWLPNPPGADTNACELTVLRSTFNPSSYPHGVGAYKATELVGLRGDFIVGVTVPSDYFSDTGHYGDPGYLWWGRNGLGDDARAYAVGQESYTLVAPNNPLPASPRTYTQFAAPRAVFTAGLGGGGPTGGPPVEPGAISDATISLATSPFAQGVLKFTLSIAGQARAFEIPLKRNVYDRLPLSTIDPGELYRLKRGKLNSNGSIEDCTEPNADGTFPSGDVFYNSGSYCNFPARAANGGSEKYDAHGVFFGTNSEFLAVNFKLNIDVPQRNRSDVTVRGLIVLK